MTDPKNIVLAPKVNPLVAMLPEYLKDPANYEKVQRLIVETLASNHSHGEVIEWAKCSKCQRRFAEKGQVLKKLGFVSSAQYMAWQRVHQEIRKKMPLVDWSKKQ